MRISDYLLKAHLTALEFFNAKRVKITDSKGGVVSKDVITKEALAATDTARAALQRGDVASFGVDLDAWKIIEALPDYFPK